MGQDLEQQIDNALDFIAPQLYITSMIFGGLFIIIGIALLFKKGDIKYLKTIGVICIAIGLLSIISSVIQS